MWCFELQYHSLFSLSVVIWRWFIMKNSDCRKWLICKWANKNGRHQISRWWLMNLNVEWLLRVKPAWFWTVSSGSSGCFAAVGELWFPKLMDDNPGWNTCCPWYMCTAFTTTSGCICRVCKCGQTLSYPLLFHCLEMRLPFCFVFSGATRSLSNHRKTEESCTYVIRLHPKDDKTCFKKVFISINLILHIVFFSRADDDSCWALPTQCWYQEGHVIFSENANGCLVLLYKRNGLSWDKEELMVWVKRAISLKGICVVEAGYSFV